MVRYFGILPKVSLTKLLQVCTQGHRTVSMTGAEKVPAQR